MSSSSKVTVKSLKEQKPPESPKKCQETLHCAVLTKSPLKPTKNGQMFTMSLCEGDPSSCIRAVCFEESMFEQFSTKQSYDIECFKLKKAFNTNSGNVEVMIDNATIIKEAADKFQIENQSFNIAQILRKECQRHRFIDVTAKVIGVEDVCVVGKHPNILEKRDVKLADESGFISLVLWKERAVKFNFHVNDVIRLENGVTTTFNNNIMLTTAFESTITKVGKDINVPAGGRQPGRKRSLISSVESDVLAIKDFKAVYKCFCCKGEIDCSGGSQLLITCRTCGTVFLSSSASISNECKVLLSYNQQWFFANSAVTHYLFDWAKSKIAPEEQDLVKVLKSRYTVRVDLERRVIEHISIEEEVPCAAATGSSYLTSNEELQAKKPKHADIYDDDVITEEEERALLEMEVEGGKAKLD